MGRTRLISPREFGKRIDRSPRTVDRLIALNPPGMPRVILINGRRHFDEAEVERFVKEVIARGILPGQGETARAPKSAGGRKPKLHEETA